MRVLQLQCASSPLVPRALFALSVCVVSVCGMCELPLLLGALDSASFVLHVLHVLHVVLPASHDPQGLRATFLSKFVALFASCHKTQSPREPECVLQMAARRWGEVWRFLWQALIALPGKTLQ